MSTMMITLYGAEKTLNEHSLSLFDDIVLPSEFDKDTLINNIILRGAEFEVLYSNLDFFREAVGLWFKVKYKTFDKWIKAALIEYKPLENYSMTETFTDTGNANFSNNSTITTDRTNLSDVSAFDSSTYSPSTKDKTDGTDTNNASGTSGNSNTHTGSRTGNIGVTTSQQMLESEYKIAAWNVYEHVADMFVGDFCLIVY